MKQLAFGLVLAVLLCQACATKQHRGETSEPAKEEEQRAASDAQTNKTSSTAAPDCMTVLWNSTSGPRRPPQMSLPTITISERRFSLSDTWTKRGKPIADA